MSDIFDVRNYDTSRHSRFMELPGGIVRRVSYNPRTFRAQWTVAGDDGRSRAIKGLYFRRGDKHLFLPETQDDTDWIMTAYRSRPDQRRKDGATVKAGGSRQFTRKPQPVQKLQDKYRFARMNLEETYGTHFRYRGETHRIYYTRTTEPLGYIKIDNARVYGYIYNARFVAFKTNDFRYKRNLEAA